MVAIPTVGDDQMQSLRESITRAAGRKAALAGSPPPRRLVCLAPAWLAARLVSTSNAQLLPRSRSNTWGSPERVRVTPGSSSLPHRDDV